MPKIIDVIVQQAYGTHYYIVLDSMPDFKYERHGSYLVADDDGLYNAYGFETPSATWKAFGGRKFDIPLKDGSIIKAYGQWWDVEPPLAEKIPMLSVGISTIDDLRKCYCFIGSTISKEKLNAWLSVNDPSSDYNKYRVVSKVCG